MEKCDDEKHLLPYLNYNNILKVEIVTEEYLSESILALFFHLKNCFPFNCKNGQFTLQENIATPDFTPKVLQGVMKSALEAASDLYQINLFVTRKTKSPLMSALQDSVHRNIIATFYNNIEKARTPSLLKFLFNMRRHFKQLKITSDLVLEPNPAEKIFTLVRNGYMSMMPIAVTCLQYYADQIQVAISRPSEATLSSPDFFVRKTQTGVELHDVPSPIPKDFANEIAQSCFAHILRASPAEINNDEDEIELPKEVVPFQTDTTISFEILLPESIPVVEEPEEAIANFRAAAWSLSKLPQKPRKPKKTPNYNTLDEAVNDIIFKPLLHKAQYVQRELVKYLNHDQQLIDIIKYMGDLYLMKRGDLHILFIRGDATMQQMPNIFKSYCGKIPYFDFRFTKDSIYTLIPIRLRKIISQEQITVYNKYYRFMSRMKRLHYALSTLKNIPRICYSLRLQLFQILVAFQQTLFFRVDVGLFKLIPKLEEAKNLNELINHHADFVKLIGKSCFNDFPQAHQQFQKFFEIGFNFVEKHNDLTEDELSDMESDFKTFKSFLAGILNRPAQANPTGLAATLLSIID